MSKSLEEIRLAPGKTIANGKYHLSHQLGAGGMGAVWRAELVGNAGFAKPVALKLMIAQEDQDAARTLFLNEARISARLHHPNIIEVYDLGQDEDLDYIAMEYVPGMDLRVLLSALSYQSSHGLPWYLAAYIIAQACKGLHYAHQKKGEHGDPLGLIHRDIKPANILISFEGRVKVIDFGIAKSAINDGKTKTGMVKGTPAYMSPEQLAAKTLDPSADLFSLGAVLYELCCGRPAFDGETLFNIIFAIQSQPPQPFTPQDQDIPEELKGIILRCLEKSRDNRYQTARALCYDLEEVLTNHCKKRIDSEELADYIKPYRDESKEQELLSNLSRSLAETGVAGVQTSQSHLRNVLPAAIDSAPSVDLASLPTQMLDADSMQMYASQATPPTRRNWVPVIIVFLCLLASAAVAGVWLMQRRSAPRIAFGSSAPSPSQATQRAPNTTRPLERQVKREAPIPEISPLAPQPSRSRSSAISMRSKTPIYLEGAAKYIKYSSRLRRPHKKPGKTKRRRVAAARKVRRAVAAQPASLLVDISPRCELFLGTRRLGLSDGQPISLEPGRHRLRCINFKKRFIRIFQVRLRSGQTREIKHRFQRGDLFVLSFPSALIFLQSNGQRFGLLGQSHEKYSLYEGSYQMWLHKKGNPAHKKMIELKIQPNQLTRPKIIW